MPDNNHHSRWVEPESASRFGLWVLSLALLAALAAVGVLSVPDALEWATVSMFVFVLWQYMVEHQARRDLTGDFAQQIHDGRVRGEDLRRARGYWQIEEQLDRADHEFALRSPAEIAEKYEAYESALPATPENTDLMDDARALGDLQAQTTLAWVLGVREELAPLGDTPVVETDD